MFAIRLVRLVSCTWLFASLSVSASAKSAEPETFDTRYISSDAAIVVVLHPQRMLAAKPRIPEYVREMLGMFKQHSGIDVKNLRQVVLQFGTEAKGENRHGLFDDEAVTGVFRFDKPVDPDKVAATGFERNTKTTHKGQVYYQPHSEHQPALWFPSNRTMIVANEWRVLKVIDEPNTMGRMVSRLREADMSADLLVEADIRSAEPLLFEAFRHFPEEGPFTPRKVIRILNRVTLTAKSQSDTPIEARLVAKDAEGAKQLASLGRALLMLAEKGWSKQRDDIRERDAGDRQELLEALVKTVDTVLAGASFSATGNELLFQVKDKEGSIDLITLIMAFGAPHSGAAEAEARLDAAEEAKAKLEEAKEEVKRAQEGERAE